MMYVAYILVIIATGVTLWFLFRSKMPEKPVPLTPPAPGLERTPAEIEKDLEASGLCKCGLPYEAYWPGGKQPERYRGDPKDKKAFQEYQDSKLLMCRGRKNAPCRNSMTIKQHREAGKLFNELRLVLKK